MAGGGTSVWFKESEMLYSYVIDTVVANCKEFFLDEGVPEDVLQDLKAVWEHHVESTHATENHPQKTNNKNRSTTGGPPQLDGMDSGGEEEPTATEEENERSERSSTLNPLNSSNALNERSERSFSVNALNVGEEITSEDDEPNVEDAETLMETENILVCQYDKIVRQKNKFRLQLKAGIMTVNEKDYVFQKCSGEADW